MVETSLTDLAYEDLRKAIVSGKLAPGERLTERGLGASLGVSRTPLRQAMIRLAQEGLLEVRSSGGYVVAVLNEAEVRELYAIRSALEGYATRLAALHAEPGEIEELSAILEEEQQGIEAMNLSVLEGLNGEFHQLLYASSGMLRLAETIETFRLQAVNHRIFEVYRDEDVRRGIAEHMKILQAVKKKRGDDAERLMRTHIDRGCKIILERRVNVS